MKLKEISSKTWSVLKGTFTEFSEDNVMRLSAALAYYAMFSIGPLLVITVGVAGLVFGHETVRHQVEQQLQGMLGSHATKTLDSMMAAQTRSGGLITTIIGLIALLFGAAGVFGQLQDSLNTIWEVKPKPGAGIWAYLRSRFLSFSMVLGTGFLLLVSLALTTFLSAATGSLSSVLRLPEFVMHAVNFIVSFAVISLLFAMMFKYLPDVKVPFRKVWVGAIATALLFTVGKYLLALYLGRASTTSSYGAAGSVLIILMWVYYASVILFFGAEFTQVFAKQTGTRVVPTKYAAPVTQHERAEQGIPHQGAEPAATHPAKKPAQPAWRPAAPALAQTRTPGTVIHQRPWQFAGLLLVAGFAGGLLVRFKTLRKAVRLYATVRRS